MTSLLLMWACIWASAAMVTGQQYVLIPVEEVEEE